MMIAVVEHNLGLCSGQEQDEIMLSPLSFPVLRRQAPLTSYNTIYTISWAHVSRNLLARIATRLTTLRYRSTHPLVLIKQLSA